MIQELVKRLQHYKSQLSCQEVTLAALSKRIKLLAIQTPNRSASRMLRILHYILLGEKLVMSDMCMIETSLPQLHYYIEASDYEFESDFSNVKIQSEIKLYEPQSLSIIGICSEYENCINPFFKSGMDIQLQDLLLIHFFEYYKIHAQAHSALVRENSLFTLKMIYYFGIMVGF